MSEQQTSCELVKVKRNNSLIKISTVAVPEWGNQSRSIKEGSQLFRTQKISGLAALSQKATQQFLNGELDGMDELDSLGLDDPFTCACGPTADLFED